MDDRNWTCPDAPFLGADFRYAQNVARDHVLPSDAPIAGVRQDSFYKIETGLLYVTRRF